MVRVWVLQFRDTYRTKTLIITCIIYIVIGIFGHNRHMVLTLTSLYFIVMEALLFFCQSAILKIPEKKSIENFVLVSQNKKVALSVQLYEIQFSNILV